MLKKGDPPMGVYYGDSVHSLDPKHWVDSMEELDYKFYNEGPVLHELVHLFTDHSASGNFRSEEHTSELQSRPQIVCRLLLEKKTLATTWIPAVPCSWWTVATKPSGKTWTCSGLG